MKPEKKVELEVYQWCFRHGWSVEVYDSKATYSLASKSYKRNLGLATGTPDIIGNDPQGLAVYLELKSATGHCSIEQIQFLRRKIEKNAFACVVRSAKELELIYSTYLKRSDKMSYLLSILPNKVKINGRLVSF